MSESIQERIAQARQQADTMKEKIKSHREQMNDTTSKLIILNLRK